MTDAHRTPKPQSAHLQAVGDLALGVVQRQPAVPVGIRQAVLNIDLGRRQYRDRHARC